MKDVNNNLIELINESFILMISIILPILSDYLVDDPIGTHRNATGWIIIALILLMCILNICI